MTPEPQPLPPDSLLARLAQERGAFADAYTLRGEVATRESSTVPVPAALAA